MQRRNFLQYVAAISTALVSLPSKLIGSSTDCHTDMDVQGPFLREGAPERNDLARDYKGDGRKLEVSGTVMSNDCVTPVSNARIELWHAGPDGQYDEHSEKFVLRGKIKTDKKGNYFFKTLIPGGYKDGPFDRPAHIHFIITAPNHEKLITQLYFEGDPKLDNDIFIQRNNGKKRALPYPKDSNGTHQVVFNIFLMK